MQIIYEDNHIIAVSKTCHEIVQGDKTGDEPIPETLKRFIKDRDQKPGNVFLGVTHRLDRPTTGVVLFAKTSKALERLNRMFAQGEVHKTYWCIVPNVWAAAATVPASARSASAASAPSGALAAAATASARSASALGGALAAAAAATASARSASSAAAPGGALAAAATASARSASSAAAPSGALAAAAPATVPGAFPPGLPPVEADLKHWLIRNEAQNRSYAYDTPEQAQRAAHNARDVKEARLHYRVIATTERYALVEVRLYTGRHHQIRCQLSHIGLPIKGDLKYGAPRSNPDGGISLHSRKAEFVHPVSKADVCIVAPVPDDNLWQALSEKL